MRRLAANLAPQLLIDDPLRNRFNTAKITYNIKSYSSRTQNLTRERVIFVLHQQHSSTKHRHSRIKHKLQNEFEINRLPGPVGQELQRHFKIARQSHLLFISP